MKKALLWIAGFTMAITGVMSVPQESRAVDYPTGTLVSCPRSYRVDYIASDGKRYPFPNAYVYYTYYNNFSTLRNISCSEFDAIPEGGHYVTARPGVKLLQFRGTPRVYAVSCGATLRWITTEAIVQSLHGTTWQRDIIMLPQQNMASYRVGDPITAAAQYNREQQRNCAPTIDAELRARNVITSTSTPTSTTPPVLSTDAFLSSLSENYGPANLNTPFNRDQVQYTMTVSSSVTSITLTAVTNHARATMTINNQIAANGQGVPVTLNTGNNVIPVQVTAEDRRTQRTYWVNIVRQAPPAQSNDATLRQLTENLTENFNPSFVSSQTAYTMTVAHAVTQITLTPTANHARATISINNNPVSSGSSLTLPLAVGENTITIVVKAENQTQRTYTVRVTRQQPARSNNAVLSSLTENISGSFSPAFTANTLTYTLSAQAGESAVILTPTASHTGATVTVNNQTVARGQTISVPLQTGSNTIRIVVTAEDGQTQRTYTVTANRAAATVVLSNDATLSALTINPTQTFSPSFNSAITDYTITVPNAVNELTLTARTTNSNATIKMNGATVISGNGTRLPLVVGRNVVNIEVTAQNGTKKVYMVVINRQQPAQSCTADTWVCDNWNACQSNGTQTCATYRKSFDCPTADTPQPPLSQSCTYTPPANTGFIVQSISENIEASLQPQFQTAVTSYTLAATEFENSVNITPIVSGNYSSITISTSLGNQSWQITSGGTIEVGLVPGQNIIEVTVRGANNTQRTYTITVNRAGQVSGSCTIPGFHRPNHVPQLNIEYCIWNRDPRNTEIRLGQAALPEVWGAPFNARITSKDQALGIGTAAVLFDIEPNYFTALATKESKLQVRPVENPNDGYYQIEEGTGFAEIKMQYGTSHFIQPNFDAYVHDWGQSSMTVGLYMKLTQEMFNRTNFFRLNEFDDVARDFSSKTKFLDYIYNRGIDSGSIPPKNALTTRRAQCIAEPDVLACLRTAPQSDAGGIDHVEDVLSYCQTFKDSNDVYETTLTWSDVERTLTNTIRPFYRFLSQAEWNAVMARAQAAFTCMQDENNTISFRYDYATLLNEIRPMLPMRSIEAPRAASWYTAQ
ncbi:MAG TPA: cadherin-like beta sandwich domain-containing protein [Candidatus Kapabacteria bacterium]|nr:cadherin-like beta sandwich domain-containing protein [Candidatus Kapabacteria bacterium]